MRYILRAQIISGVKGLTLLYALACPKCLGNIENFSTYQQPIFDIRRYDRPTT